MFMQNMVEFWPKKIGSVSKVTVHALVGPIFSFLPRAPQMFKRGEILHRHHALEHLPCKKFRFFWTFLVFFFEFTVAREQMSSGAEMDYRLIYIKYVIHALRYTHNFEKQNSTLKSRVGLYDEKGKPFVSKLSMETWSRCC